MKQDLRKLTLDQKVILRKTVVNAIASRKMRQIDAVNNFGLTKKTVHLWLKEYRELGKDSFSLKKPGRPASTIAKLDSRQVARIVKIITDNNPQQIKFPFALWDRKAVQALISHKFNISLSLPTIGRYLKQWGFTPQRPLARAYQRNPEAVSKFLNEEFPSLKNRAKKDNGEIHFLDEMGLQNNNHHYIRGYSKKGQTPVITKSGSRLSINMISTVANNGKMRFMTYNGSMNQDRFILFLKQLIKCNFAYQHSNHKKIFLIADNLKVHKGNKVKKFIDKNKDKIEIFFLPAYSPELNPDELLNHDVKANALKNTITRTQDQLKSNLKSYLFKLQKSPQKIRNYFKKEYVRYAM